MGTIRPRRLTSRRRTAPRWTVEDWEYASTVLNIRAGGKCERCGAFIMERVERHHRQRRRDGGDRLSNLLWLDRSCHTWITEHPAEAVANGWIVLANGDADPALVPVRIDGYWWMLDDMGGKELVP